MEYSSTWLCSTELQRPLGSERCFVTYLKAAPEPGLLPSIWVDDINAMVASQIIYDRMSFKSEMLSDASQGSIWAQSGHRFGHEGFNLSLDH